MTSPLTVTIPQRSFDVQARELDSDKQNKIVKEALMGSLLEEDTRSSCSTNLGSQTPTIESLPPFSHDAPLDSLDDANDLDSVLNDTLADGKAELCQVSPRSERSDQFQDVVDKIFETGAASLLDLNFPLAIANPQLEGCPLIGCSAGFTTLCGYEMADIVGFDCGFVTDPAPAPRVFDKTTRSNCQEFCLAAAEGKCFRMPSLELHSWVLGDRPCNELISVQTSARKDGSLFESMLLMSNITLGDFDDEQPYIVILQAQLPGGTPDSNVFRQHLQQLDRNMTTVERILGGEFIICGSMRRQDGDIHSDCDSNMDSDDDSC